MAQSGNAADMSLCLPRFEGLKNISFPRKEFNDEWDDSKLASYERIEMFKLSASSPNSRAMCLSALDCFYKNVSPYNVGLVVVLAWNLVSPDGGRQVFEVDELSGMTSKLIDVSTLDADVRTQCAITSNYVFPQNFDVLLKATAYLAASALRLITKPSENYSRSWSRILEDYQKIYETQFPIRGFRPNDECLYCMKLLLHHEAVNVIGNSIGCFLYSFESLKAEDKGICRTLFEQHLSCTGMHAYPLFVSARDKLNMSSEELIALLKHRMTNDALETIVAILDNHESPQDLETKRARARKTWRYARLFSDAAFSRLQTKNCTKLVSILAHLNKLLGTEGTGDLLKIKQIANMSEIANQYNAEVASRIYALRKQ